MIGGHISREGEEDDEAPPYPPVPIGNYHHPPPHHHHHRPSSRPGPVPSLRPIVVNLVICIRKEE